jgi:hypothetical protein
MVDSHLDKVAQAIWNTVADEPMRKMHPWEKLSDKLKDKYRAQAQAAIDALELPVLWGAAIPLEGGGGFDANANVCHSKKDAEKLLASLNRIYPDDRRCIVSRFGSGPWVASSPTAGTE